MAIQQAPGIDRTDLQQHDLSAPGREVIPNRATIGPEAPAVRHKHPGEEIEPPVGVTAGEVFFVPAETVHTARAAGGSATELATYVVEKGKPLITLVD